MPPLVLTWPRECTCWSDLGPLRYAYRRQSRLRRARVAVLRSRSPGHGHCAQRIAAAILHEMTTI